MKYLIPTILVIVLLSSCTKEKSKPLGAGRTQTCEAFDPEELSKWFPYQLRVTNSYIDSNGNVYQLTADSVNYSDEYKGPSNGCVITGEIYALPSPSNPLDIYMEVICSIIYGNPVGYYLTLKWIDAEVDFNRYSSNRDTLNPTNKPKKIKDKMIFGGKEYQTVHEIYANSVTVKYIYIVKGSGVVAFTTQDDNLYWLDN